MKFLGERIPKKSTWMGDFDWQERRGYTLCPVDDPVEQMECTLYEPGFYFCDSWQCKHCACGSSDICSAPKRGDR